MTWRKVAKCWRKKIDWAGGASLLCERGVVAAWEGRQRGVGRASARGGSNVNAEWEGVTEAGIGVFFLLRHSVLYL